MSKNENANFVDLKLGWECNHNCVHCVVADKKAQSSKEQFSMQDLRTRMDAFCRDIGQITLTGGEPFLHPDILEVLRYLRTINPNISINIQTNGTRLHDEEFVKTLAPLVQHLTVAIHSHEQSVHDKICAAPGSWVKSMAGIGWLQKYRIPFSTQTVISKFNEKGLVDTFAFFHSLGIEQSILTFPHAMGNALRNYSLVVPRYSDIIPHLPAILSIHPQTSLSAIPACCIPDAFPTHIFRSFFEYKQNPSQETSICVELTNQSELNGSEENFFDMIKQDFAKSESCRRCLYDSMCNGVWKEYLDYNQDALDLPTVLCWDRVPREMLYVLQLLQQLCIPCVDAGFGSDNPRELSADVAHALERLRAEPFPLSDFSRFLQSLSRGEISVVPTCLPEDITDLLNGVLRFLRASGMTPSPSALPETEENWSELQVLVLCDEGLGDALLAYPFFHSLKKAFGQSNIHVLGTFSNAPLLAVHGFRSLSARPVEIPIRRADILFNLRTGPRVDDSLQQFPCETYVGFKGAADPCSPAAKKYLVPRGQRYVKDEYLQFLQVLEKEVGDPPPAEIYKLLPCASEAPIYSEYCVFSISKTNYHLDNEFYISILRRHAGLINGMPILLTGFIDRELEIAEFIVRSNEFPNVVNLCKQSNLLQFIRLIKNSSLTITFNSFAMHLADVFDRKMIVYCQNNWNYLSYLPSLAHDVHLELL